MKQVTKLTVIIAAAVAMMGYQAKAMDVVWSAQISTFLTDTSGVGLPIGDLIKVGWDSNNTVGGFTSFASGAVGDSLNIAGTFADDNNITGTSGFFSKQMYIEVYTNPGGTGTPALLTNPGWVFPADDTGGVGIDVGDAGLVIVSGATFVAGGVTAPVDIAGGDAVELAVPEPSSIALVVLGLIGGIGMIRRRK
jgi:hypothetical protein